MDRAATAIEFCFAIGANYFFQIAKLRAFRMLWARAVESFGGTPSSARERLLRGPRDGTRLSMTQCEHFARHYRSDGRGDWRSGFSRSRRSTSATEQPDEASRRLARNTQLLLKHEALLGNVADAAGGSYYVEAITDFLAREGWKRMQEIEARGGYRKALDGGEIGHALEQKLAAREKAVATRRRVLVGTNQFANLAEKALDRVDEKRMNETRRGARDYEELRLRIER